MPTYLTTAQKKKAKAEADYIASLGPKGPKKRKSNKPPEGFRRAAPTQTLLGIDKQGHVQPDSKLHAPGCDRLDNIWHGSHRMATEKELQTHEGCYFCT